MECDLQHQVSTAFFSGPEIPDPGQSSPQGTLHPGVSVRWTSSQLRCCGGLVSTRGQSSPTSEPQSVPERVGGGLKERELLRVGCVQRGCVRPGGHMLAVQAPARVCMTCACAHACVPHPGPVAPVNWACFLICPRKGGTFTLTASTFVAQHFRVTSLKIFAHLRVKDIRPVTGVGGQGGEERKKNGELLSSALKSNALMDETKSVFSLS